MPEFTVSGIEKLHSKQHIRMERAKATALHILREILLHTHAGHVPIDLLPQGMDRDETEGIFGIRLIELVCN